jgi:hypothetical protein
VHALPVGGQSAGTLHATHPAATSQTCPVAAQLVVAPATQVFAPLHVLAAV